MGRVYLAYSSKGRVHNGRGDNGTKLQKKKAERSHLQQQTGSQESELEVGPDYTCSISKPTPSQSDVFSPARPYLLKII